MAFRFLSQANIHYVSEWFTLNWSVKSLIIRMHYQQKKNSRQNERQISVDETGRTFCRQNGKKILSTRREENFCRRNESINDLSTKWEDTGEDMLERNEIFLGNIIIQFVFLIVDRPTLVKQLNIFNLRK